MSATTPSWGWWWRTALAVAAHPTLWATAVGQALRLAAPGWWRRPPFIPLPDPTYLRFRMETQYGNGEPDPADVVTYLHWVRGVRRGSPR